mmetsp:Transcript_18627/g.50509  ORF Transcript_18627/g.50509 Transcript_18627/m.50509 type:complete len:105 (-) Transcript_18627:1102-1416(-)
MRSPPTGTPTSTTTFTCAHVSGRAARGHDECPCALNLKKFIMVHASFDALKLDGFIWLHARSTYSTGPDPIRIPAHIQLWRSAGAVDTYAQFTRNSTPSLRQFR